VALGETGAAQRGGASDRIITHKTSDNPPGSSAVGLSFIGLSSRAADVLF
jgi:hypothetical protein